MLQAYVAQHCRKGHGRTAGWKDSPHTGLRPSPFLESVSFPDRALYFASVDGSAVPFARITYICRQGVRALTDVLNSTVACPVTFKPRRTGPLLWAIDTFRDPMLIIPLRTISARGQSFRSVRTFPDQHLSARPILDPFHRLFRL